MRHFEVRFLWLQELTRSQQSHVVRVRVTAHPADALTKSMSFSGACKHLSFVMVFDSVREGDRVEDGVGISDISLAFRSASCVSLEVVTPLLLFFFSCASRHPWL